MTPLRMIATDLDGTLLRTDATISDRTRVALRHASAAGAEVVLVTARPPRYLDTLGLDCGLVATAVCSNGAIVYDVAARAIVHAQALSAELAQEVADAIATALPGVGFAIETGHRLLCEPTFTKRFPGDTGSEVSLPAVEDLWRVADPIIKLLAWSPDQDVDVMLAVACETVRGKAEVTHSGGKGLLEISVAGVTKSATLAAICLARGIDPTQVIAFGDMPNDLTILNWAGTGYATANAHPTVLAAARWHTHSNDQDGVAHILEQHFPPPG